MKPTHMMNPKAADARRSPRTRRGPAMIAAVAAIAAMGLSLTGCNNKDPGQSPQQPTFRWQQNGEPSSGERGDLMINEVDFAGSVSDKGVYDPNDVFIELLNKNPRPINVSGWYLIVRGDFSNTYRFPKIQKPIQPNSYFVIAREKNGAFRNVANIFIPNLKIGKERFYIELRDYDKRLMEQVGSTDERVFAGGYDTVSVRSMERVQLVFGNRGNMSRSWHFYSSDVGFSTVAKGYQKYTLASPGAANSQDYSGSTSSGSFQ